MIMSDIELFSKEELNDLIIAGLTEKQKELVKRVHFFAEKWRLIVNNVRFFKGCSTYGRCKITKKSGSDGSISKEVGIWLNDDFIAINSDNAINQVILHELAHINTDGHGYRFKQECRRIGVTDTRCFEGEHNEVEGRFKYKCPSCGIVSHYGKRLKIRRSCGSCGIKANGRSGFDSRFVIQLVSES